MYYKYCKAINCSELGTNRFRTDQPECKAGDHQECIHTAHQFSRWLEDNNYSIATIKIDASSSQFEDVDSYSCGRMIREETNK